MKPDELKKKCQGACERHMGEIKTVIVKDKLYFWGKFDYCAVAIEEDKSRGLQVEVCDD